jgi:transposase
MQYKQPDALAQRVLKFIESGRMSVTEAVMVSGISRATIYRWMRQFNIERDVARMKYVVALWEKRAK